MWGVGLGVLGFGSKVSVRVYGYTIPRQPCRVKVEGGGHKGLVNLLFFLIILEPEVE